MRKSTLWNASRELVVPNHFLQPPPVSTPTPLLADQPARGSCDWHLHLGLPTEALLALTTASAAAAAAAAAVSSTRAKASARAAAGAASAASAAAAAATANVSNSRPVRPPPALRPASRPRASLALRPAHVRTSKRIHRRGPTPGYLTVFSVPEDSIPSRRLEEAL